MLMLPLEKKINLSYEFERLVHKKFEVVVPTAVLKELEELREKGKQSTKLKAKLAIELANKFTILQTEANTFADEEIDRYDNSYPYREIDIISCWNHIFYSHLDRKVILKIEARRISEMLSRPIDFNKARLMEFFSQVLQIVIFTYLHEYAELSQQTAKHLTAKIINSYMESKGFERITPLSGKDIDSALQ